MVRFWYDFFNCFFYDLGNNVDENIFYYYRLSVSVNGQESLFTDEIQVKPVFIPNQAPTIDTPNDIQFFEDNTYNVI